MDKLLRLTEQIVELDSVSEDFANGLREYDLVTGTAFSSTIYQSPLLSMAVCFASKGTIIPYHIHKDSAEVIVCYKGSMTLITEEDRIEMKAGDVSSTKSGIGHMFNMHEDVKIVIITIPPDFSAMARIKQK